MTAQADEVFARRDGGPWALWSMWPTPDISRFGWMYLLALPYFITWFYSYSYHYRLSFAIVPLMLMP